MTFAENTNLPYSAPMLVYHGRVGEVTLSHHVMIGTQFAAAFASSVVSQPTGGNNPIVANGPSGGNSPPVVHGPTVAPAPTVANGPSAGPPALLSRPPVHHGLPHGVTSPIKGGGDAPGSSGGGTKGVLAGKQLPFTGMAVALTVGTGLALTSAGETLRRLLRRHPPEH